MLRSLTIRNFALISATTIDFHKGFTAITGETGSGKSILLGALNLLRGERADYSVIRNADEKTIVEGEFEAPENLREWFTSNDIDWSHETIIRREIAAQGKSRAFVNDTPVQLTQLRELADKLIYIHSQHETLELRSVDFQLELLDAFSGNAELAADYKQNYNEWRAVSRELQQQRELVATSNRELDFLEFQKQEIASLNLDTTDYHKLETELSRLENAGELRQAFSALAEGLNTDNGVLDQLRHIKSALDKLKGSDDLLVGFSNRLNGTLVELDDLSAEAANALEGLDSDPERLAAVTEKVDRFNAILTKNHLQTQEELQTLLDSVSSQLEALTQSDEKIHELEQKSAALNAQLMNSGAELHKKRQSGAQKLEKLISGFLEELKLPDAKINFQLESRKEPNAHGLTDVSLLFSANPGHPLKSVEKAASGGELSRLMLVIQRVLGEYKQLPTLIFDEIDTGVSGEVAVRIGKMLREMGENIQLLAITHLPQVASRAANHLEVSKRAHDGHTETSIRSLSKDQRVLAVARLLSGDEPNAIAIANAEHLLAE